MGVIVFGIGMFLVVLPATWLLEKAGVMEVPARGRNALRPYRGAR